MQAKHLECLSYCFGPPDSPPRSVPKGQGHELCQGRVPGPQPLPRVDPSVDVGADR